VGGLNGLHKGLGLKVMVGRETEMVEVNWVPICVDEAAFDGNDCVRSKTSLRHESIMLYEASFHVISSFSVARSLIECRRGLFKELFSAT